MIIVIDAFSLDDPTILNDLKKVHSYVEHEPTSQTGAYHFVFFLEVDEPGIGMLRTHMLKEWFALVIDQERRWVVFADNQFILPKQLREATQWAAEKHSIPAEFLDFEQYIKRYNDDLSRSKG